MSTRKEYDEYGHLVRVLEGLPDNGPSCSGGIYDPYTGRRTGTWESIESLPEFEKRTKSGMHSDDDYPSYTPKPPAVETDKDYWELLGYIIRELKSDGYWTLKRAIKQYDNYRGRICRIV